MFESLAKEFNMILNDTRLLWVNVFSLLATLSLIASCLVKERKKMFLFQAGQCGLLCVSQTILGMYGGIVTTSLGALRDTANAYNKLDKKKSVILAATIGVVGTVLNFAGGKPWYGLLPVIAAVVYSVGCQIFYKFPNLLRINLMINLSFWVVYSFIIKDFMTTISNGFTAIVDMAAFIIIFVQENRAKCGIVIGRKERKK